MLLEHLLTSSIEDTIRRKIAQQRQWKPCTSTAKVPGPAAPKQAKAKRKAKVPPAATSREKRSRATQQPTAVATSDAPAGSPRTPSDAARGRPGDAVADPFTDPQPGARNLLAGDQPAWLSQAKSFMPEHYNLAAAAFHDHTLRATLAMMGKISPRDEAERKLVSHAQAVMFVVGGFDRLYAVSANPNPALSDTLTSLS